METIAAFPKAQGLLQAFLEEKFIQVLSAEQDVSYKEWLSFINKILKDERALWALEEPCSNFFRVWRLQNTHLPFLLSHQNFYKKGYLKLRKHELEQAGQKFEAEVFGFKTSSTEDYWNRPWYYPRKVDYFRQDYPFKKSIDRQNENTENILKKERLTEVEKQKIIYTCLQSNPSKYLLSGTPTIKIKIESFWSDGVLVEEPIEIKKRLYAVKIFYKKGYLDSTQVKSDELDFEDDVTRCGLQVMGSTYSFYQLQSALFSHRSRELRTLVAIHEKLPLQNFPRYYLPGHDLITRYLLESIKKCQTLHCSAELSASVEQSISYLKQYIQWMKSYKKDFERFSLLFEMAFEEICLLLMMGRNYTKSHYKEIMNKIHEVSGLLHREHFLMSSGMDALSTAIIAALKDHPDSGVYLYSGNYYELELCLKHGARRVDTPQQIVVFNLNPTCYVDNKVSLEEVNQWLSLQSEPVTLIVDHTLEEPVTLEALFQVIHKWIELGKLNVILCKSQQKYTSFGLSKVMSGNISVIHKSEHFQASLKFLNQMDEANNYYKNPEFQIIAHQLELNADFDFEKKATLQVRKKSKLIHDLCEGTF